MENNTILNKTLLRTQ